MSARAVILSRIRTGLADRPQPAPPERTYLLAGSSTATEAQLVELLADRLRDYHATVDVTTADRVRDAIAAALAARAARTVVVPDGFPAPLLTGIAADMLGDVPPLSTDALDAADAVLTTCAYAIAETGTIVLDHGPGQGRRALTLVPDYHLVVIRPEQVLAQVPDAVAALAATSTQTWISGPSATSDIELSRVEGVHGPRTLHVIMG
ncbi:MAG: L-lactate dehydrogenase complex protein LldG [Pseudonocardiales bacterium]|nr:L-lactate dehydrogenase complex protein LldG [Pseudonocardiales bacterium]